MSDNLISRKELKEILSASENFKTLSDAEKLYIIYEKLQSLEELYREEKELFSTGNYLISPRQIVVMDNMMEQSNSEDLIGAYYSLLAFLEDDGEEHEDIVYIRELDELYFEMKKLILLIEQNVDFEKTFPQLVDHFSLNSMLQFSLFDNTHAFNEQQKSITLNGNVLNISWEGKDYDFTDASVAEKIKEVIIQYRKELYSFSKRQEDRNGEFSHMNRLIDADTDECIGAMDGIMFSVSNEFEHEELNDFYSNFKISLYHALNSIINGEELEEYSVNSEEIVAEEPLESSNAVENPKDDSKQKKIIAEMLDISIEDAYENSKNFEDMDAVYYWNPNGSSVIIDGNLHYLLTNAPVASSQNLIAAYQELRRETEKNEELIINDESCRDMNELTTNMIKEINSDYQLDRSIDNVFDFADSLINDQDLEVFWQRVSADTLGYIIVKELEDNNALYMEQLKNDVNSFDKFYSICVDSQLQSKNKKIINISSMTRQAPDKTLKTVYSIICSSLGISAEIEETIDIQEPVYQEASEELAQYTVLSDTYYNFIITLPARFEKVTKNSESSFKIGDINVMIAKCSSFDKLDERANQWLENSAKTNSQTMLSELDCEYYLGDKNLRVLEKQLEKNGKRRVYKFIYFNGAMIIFAYSSLNESLSEIIDSAIVSIQVLADAEEKELVASEVARRLRVEHYPHSIVYEKEDLKEPETIIQEYDLHEDLDLDLKDFKIKILEVNDSYVKVRIYDNPGITIDNSIAEFKVDYQIGDCVGIINYNDTVQLYRNAMNAGEYWNLRFE